MADQTPTPLTTPAPTAPATGAPAPAPTPGDPPAMAAAPEWAKEWGLAPDVADWMSKTGFKTPADLASSAHATKKLVGHRPEDVIVRPKDGDTAAMIKALRALGAPEKPEDYGLTPPDGDDGAFLKTATGWFAELGVPKSVAAGLAERWGAYVKQSSEAQAEAFAKDAAAGDAALRQAWGQDYERNATAARAGLTAAGLTAEQGRAIEIAIGVKAATEAFAKLGGHLVEPKFRGHDAGGSGFGAKTAAEAQAELSALRADRAFGARFAAGDVDARKRVADLNLVIASAMPDRQAGRAGAVAAM